MGSGRAAWGDGMLDRAGGDTYISRDRLGIERPEWWKQRLRRNLELIPGVERSGSR